MVGTSNQSVPEMTIDIMEDVGLVATHPTLEFFIHPSIKRLWISILFWELHIVEVADKQWTLDFSQSQNRTTTNEDDVDDWVAPEFMGTTTLW